MKKTFFLLLFVFFSSIVSSQNTRYWVAFKDKSGSPYNISTPSQFLSARAINRRTLHSYPVTLEDIPVNQNYIDSVKATGAALISRSRWYNGIIVWITNPSQLTAINALPFVQSTKPVAIIKPLRTTVDVLENNA